MSTSSESTRVSISLDPTPFNERGIIMMPDAEEQEIFDETALHSYPRLLPPLPTTYTENYASFPTAFLSPTDVQKHWNNLPLLINDFNSESVPETQFLDAVGRVSVYEHFTRHIVKGTVIDFGLGESEFRFMVTYSHLMDGRNAYIRIVAYDEHGRRCHSHDPDFGNFILVIPRHLNDVPFPEQLRFHALYTTSYNPNNAHKRIRKAAWSSMSKYEEESLKFGSLLICNTDDW